MVLVRRAVEEEKLGGELTAFVLVVSAPFAPIPDWYATPLMKNWVPFVL